jgi:hypothetical protein
MAHARGKPRLLEKHSLPATIQMVLHFPGDAFPLGSSPLRFLEEEGWGRIGLPLEGHPVPWGIPSAAAVSPIYAGWIFDRTGSDTIALFPLTIILLICAGIFAHLGRPAFGGGTGGSPAAPPE